MQTKRTIPWIELGKWDSESRADQIIHNQNTLNKRRAKNKLARKTRKRNKK